jgi:hypothetical protein
MIADSTPEEDGGFFLPVKTVEALEESLKEIKASVEEIAQVLYKGNGHSLISKILLLENKIGELEKRNDRGDSKVWDSLKIVLALVIGALISFVLSGKLIHP